jgi:CHAD domain-containing protein
MARKKWEIPDVPAEQDVVRVAQTILALRLRDALALVDEFRASHAEESLHQLRIALRRLRYPLETLLGFFPRRTGLRFLRALNTLQQSAGDGRDLDVMLMTLEGIREKDPAAVPETLLRRIARRRSRRYGSIDRAFEAFLGNDALYAFKIMIGYDEALPPPAPPAADPEPGRKAPARKRPPVSKKKSTTFIAS